MGQSVKKSTFNHESTLPYRPDQLDDKDLRAMHRDLEAEFIKLANASDALYELIVSLQNRIKTLEVN